MQKPQPFYLHCQILSGMFCRSASLAIPYRKARRNTVHLPGTPWAHESQRFIVTRIESQREIALVEALSRPIPYYQQAEVGEKKRAFVLQGLCF